MFKSKQNNGIAKTRPNGDTPLSLTPNPMAYLAKKDQSDSVKAATDKAMSDAKNRLLMEKAESKKKNK
jgi:hypothetical protein